MTDPSVAPGIVPSASVASTAVSVRMYNVGFGDCFLITIDSSQGPRRVLIDCGTHPSSTGPRRASDAVPVLLSDLAEGGAAPRIDIVIMSHRHKDHISGFELRALWDTVEVGEVWLPWTENPDDPQAVDLLSRMSSAAKALHATSLAMAADNSPMVDLAADIIANSLTNEKAMDTLHHGFHGKPLLRYLSVTSQPLTTALLPGVIVHVLGPSRDEAVIRDLNPPKTESWMQVAAGAPEVGGGGGRPPFDVGWAIPYDDFIADRHVAKLHLSRTIRSAIRASASDQLVLAAAALEQAVNGTSLMLLFEIGDLLLLFPGDAQWGTWDMVLKDPTVVAQLSQIDFYKIGHHGSQNATPPKFANEVLPGGTWAALPFAQVKKWPSIPEPNLIDAIRAKATILEADKFPAPGSNPRVTVRGDVSVELQLAPET